MEVRVLLFGPEAAVAGRSDVSVRIDGACTCAALKREIERIIPALKGRLTGARLAVNSEFASPEQTISLGDEVALIGMVSGG
jgi:molybdopterin converting factor small subunit